KRTTHCNLNCFTTVRRCVVRIIEILEIRASVFCKKFEKSFRLLIFKSNCLFQKPLLIILYQF
ncbi:hypothetical protein C5N92_10410, partial [Glaesserella australis]